MPLVWHLIGFIPPWWGGAAASLPTPPANRAIICTVEECEAKEAPHRCGFWSNRDRALCRAPICDEHVVAVRDTKMCPRHAALLGL